MATLLVKEGPSAKPETELSSDIPRAWLGLGLGLGWRLGLRVGLGWRLGLRLWLGFKLGELEGREERRGSYPADSRACWSLCRRRARPRHGSRK